MPMDDDFNIDARIDRDFEREPTHRTRQRIPVVLDARGTTKQRFEPDAGRDAMTEEALALLRREGLL
jgi:hypothetical protein